MLTGNSFGLNYQLQMKPRINYILVAIISAASILVGCNSNQPVVPNTPAASNPVLTATPVATSTIAATPTAEITATPNPRAVFTRYLQANSLLSSGKYDQAIPQFEVVIRIHPNFAQAYHGRGLAYYKDGQPEMALADFTKAIELKPNYADAHRNRGVLYTNRGNLTLGIQDLRRALTLYEQEGDFETATKVGDLIDGIVQ